MLLNLSNVDELSLLTVRFIAVDRLICFYLSDNANRIVSSVCSVTVFVFVCVCVSVSVCLK